MSEDTRRIEELRAAFNLVASKKNWKNPIKCTLPADADINLIALAVTYFTGSVLESIKLPDGRWRVSAVGYYVAIGS